MPKKNITKQILTSLESYGVGYYADISPIVKSAFPPQASDKSDDIYNVRVREYLDNLERAGYIKCNHTKITRSVVYVEAAILDAGLSRIKPDEKSWLFKIVELASWMAAVGGLAFTIYSYYHPLEQKSSKADSSTDILKDSSGVKR
jgi:hypothetical protein